MAKYTPDAHLIESLASNSLRWKEAFGEWIDNAFDARATSIRFRVCRKKLEIADDGDGFADLTVMGRLGDHSKSKGTTLGRYGIGSKEANVWAGGVSSRVKISSVHKGMRRNLVIDWKRLMRNNWEGADPTEGPAHQGERGTSIDVTPLARRFPSGKDLDNLLGNLGYIYFPAIVDAGKHISISVGNKAPMSVSPWQPPAFEDVEETSIVVQCEDGKARSASVRCGVVKPGERNTRPGITYVYGWRVVKEASSSGCGSYPVARVCGVVKLGDDWRLTKNKNDIAEHASTLYAEVERTVSRILEKAKTQASTLSSAELLNKVADRLNTALLSRKGRKERREKKGERGTHTRCGGKRKRRAKKTRPGGDMDGLGTDLKFEIVDSLPDGAIGRFDAPQKVLISREHGAVHEAEESQNDLALAVLAFGLIADAQQRYENLEIFATRSPYPTFLGDLLVDARVDGKPVVRLEAV